MQRVIYKIQTFKLFDKRPSFSIKERSIHWLLKVFAFLTIFVTFSILFILIKDSIIFFQHVSVFDFLFGTKWEAFGEPKKLGVLPLLSGSLMIALGAILVAIPLGLGTAIFLTQYSKPKFANIVKPIVEILGGVPTVVYGYFALTVITPLLRIFFPNIGTFNALSGVIVVGVAILPMIASISSDCLLQIPKSIIQAGYALGMNKFQVTIHVIIPSAFSGIVSSVILAFSRALGETMAVTLAAGATPNLNFDYLQGIQTITSFIVQVSLGDTPTGSIEYYTIYALGLTLFLITFLFNYVANFVVRKFAEQYQ